MSITTLERPTTEADFVAEDARFAAAHAAVHAAALAAASLAGAPAAVLDLVRDIDAYMDEEFPNCSMAFEEADEWGDGDWTCLADMAVWEYAGNNCESATEHVLELVVEKIGQNHGEEHATVELKWAEFVHFANTLTTGGTTWVVDYTARQFDRNLPFPYVAALTDWKHVIDAAALAAHSLPASTTHLH